MYRLYYGYDDYPDDKDSFKDSNTLESLLEYITERSYHIRGLHVTRTSFYPNKIVEWTEIEIAKDEDDPRIVAAMEKGRQKAEEKIRPQLEAKKLMDEELEKSQLKYLKSKYEGK